LGIEQGRHQDRAPVIFQKVIYSTFLCQMRRIAPAVWGVWHHAITTIAFYTRGHSSRQRVRDCDLKELAMPDLDQIKQEEQGARDQRGRFARGRSGNPAGRAAAATASKPRCPAIARRRGRGADPQSRRAGARRHCGCASNASSGRIANARSNSRCRQSATPLIWRGQRGES
jgi:hypothetical protein